MSGNSGIYNERDERRRLRNERREARRAMRGRCDSLAHAIRGPLTLVTLGILFALNNFTPYGFDKTWPVLLIVFGLLTLVGRSTAEIPPVPPGPAAPPPPYGYTPPAGGYRQSSYTQPPAASAPNEGAPAGTSKGGFGTSAPPRQPDAGQTPEGGTL